jgi:hypothetical protein
MKTALVSGAIANKPLNGGEPWIRLSWILGLKRLGFDVYFVEQCAPPISPGLRKSRGSLVWPDGSRCWATMESR